MRKGRRKEEGKKEGKTNSGNIIYPSSISPKEIMSSHSPTSLGPVLATSLALNRLPSSQPFIQVGKHKLLSLSTMLSSSS